MWSPLSTPTPEATPVVGPTPEPEFNFGEHYIGTLGIFALFIFLLVLMDHLAFRSL